MDKINCSMHFKNIRYLLKGKYIKLSCIVRPAFIKDGLSCKSKIPTQY